MLPLPSPAWANGLRDRPCCSRKCVCGTAKSPPMAGFGKKVGQLPHRTPYDRWAPSYHSTVPRTSGNWTQQSWTKRVRHPGSAGMPPFMQAQFANWPFLLQGRTLNARFAWFICSLGTPNRAHCTPSIVPLCCVPLETRVSPSHSNIGE